MLTQMILSKLWPLSSLSSSPPWIHPSPLSATCSKFQIWTTTNSCTAPNISVSIIPPSDNHLYPSSLLPLGPQLHPSFGAAIHWFFLSCFFLSPTPNISSLRFLPSSGVWFNHYHHSFASSLELLYFLGQTPTSTLVKCNTWLALVPVLMNLNVAEGLNSWASTLNGGL